jgi:hypothetical protein
MPKKIQIDENVDGNKEIIFDLMEKEGLTQLFIYFDGGGDDGQVNEIEGVGGEDIVVFLGQVVEGAKIKQGSDWRNGADTIVWQSDPTVQDMVYDVCYRVLQEKFCGWENDNGSCGKFVFDATKRKVELDMKQRYIEYDESTYTL